MTTATNTGRTLVELGFKPIDSECTARACGIVNILTQRPARMFEGAPEIMREDDGTVWLYLAPERLLVALYAPDWKGPGHLPRIDLKWLRGLTATVAGTTNELRDWLTDAPPGQYAWQRRYIGDLARTLEKFTDEVFEGVEDFAEAYEAAQLRPDQVLIAVAQTTKPLKAGGAKHGE